jgi:hypothetical protein
MLSPKYRPVPLSPKRPGAVGSSNQSDSPPPPATAAAGSPSHTITSAKAQLDERLGQLHSERTVAEHELAVLKQTVTDLESRVASLQASARSNANTFDMQFKQQDALLQAAQADLAKLTHTSSDDGLSPRVASLSLSKASAQVLMKRIGILELYRDRVEAQLETHRALVDSRVSAITASRDAAYTSLVRVHLLAVCVRVHLLAVCVHGWHVCAAPSSLALVLCWTCPAVVRHAAVFLCSCGS